MGRSCSREGGSALGRRSPLPHCSDGGLECRVEAVVIERFVEAVATNEILQPGAHLGESHMDTGGIELTIELLEHFCGRDVDIGHGLALDDNPGGMSFADDVADLRPKG